MEYLIGFFILIMILGGLYNFDKIGDKNLEKVAQGQMSKVEYQGHSYVVWGINAGGGVVHDPDCKCFKKE